MHTTVWAGEDPVASGAAHRVRLARDARLAERLVQEAAAAAAAEEAVERRVARGLALRAQLRAHVDDKDDKEDTREDLENGERDREGDRDVDRDVDLVRDLVLVRRRARGPVDAARVLGGAREEGAGLEGLLLVVVRLGADLSHDPGQARADASDVTELRSGGHVALLVLTVHRLEEGKEELREERLVGKEAGDREDLHDREDWAERGWGRNGVCTAKEEDDARSFRGGGGARGTDGSRARGVLRKTLQ